MDSFFFDQELSARETQRITRQEELRTQKGLENYVWRPEAIGWLEILNYSVRTCDGVEVWPTTLPKYWATYTDFE